MTPLSWRAASINMSDGFRVSGPADSSNKADAASGFLRLRLLEQVMGSDGSPEGIGVTRSGQPRVVMCSKTIFSSEVWRGGIFRCH
jgi:hypothetical protein